MLEQFVIPIRLEQRQVQQGIVRGIVVLVMHRLRPKKTTTDYHRHYDPMFHHVAILPSHRKELDWTTNVLHSVVISVLPEVRHPALPGWIEWTCHLLAIGFQTLFRPPRTPKLGYPGHPCESYWVLHLGLCFASVGAELRFGYG
jgi:hypothetical protein